MHNPLPSDIKQEISNAENFQIGDVGRDYRDVNKRNGAMDDGMTKLRPEDHGRGSNPSRNEAQRNK